MIACNSFATSDCASPTTACDWIALSKGSVPLRECLPKVSMWSRMAQDMQSSLVDYAHTRGGQGNERGNDLILE
eukprot:7932621-Alexandrium_andersonii.AAC.1